MTSFFRIVIFTLLFIGQAQAGIHLKVASFNTWGVPVAVWDTWRYAAAMKELDQMSPDLILLEEVFTHKGRKAYDSTQYPYTANGPKGFPRLIGSGLKILSKHPILRTAKLVYRSCMKDDCLSRKGALLAVVSLPTGQNLNVIVTHLNARGEDTTRTDQVQQLMEFVSAYAEPDAPILLSGDFNFNPTSAVYPFLLKQLKDFSGQTMVDTWSQTHDASDPGYTNDSILNAYAHDYNVRTNFPLTQERIDFQFVGSLGKAASFTPVSSRLIFNTQPFYSDHYGLMGEYELE